MAHQERKRVGFQDDLHGSYRDRSVQNQDTSEIDESWSSSEISDCGNAPILIQLSKDVSDFCSSTITVLEQPPTPLEFMRNFVATSRPCIIKNVFLEPKSNKTFGLTLDDIFEVTPPTTVITVNVTPDGHGDCVRHVRNCACHKNEDDEILMFVKPLEKQMTIDALRDGLRGKQKSDRENMDHFISKNQCLTEEKRYAFPIKCHCQPTEENDVSGDAELSSSGDVLYYSLQDDCLRSTDNWSALWESGLIPKTVDFAEEAFGSGPPDAVNIWIGNENAVSSMHMDHYENMFYVASGEKLFTLCPPSDVAFLHWKKVQAGTFSKAKGNWQVIPDKDNHGKPSMINWIQPDLHEYLQCCGGKTECEPNEASFCERHFPLLSLTHPMEIKVKAGEMLYLPPLWFHRVTQSCETVGINYWYDMKFDTKWCYFQMLQRMALDNA